MPEELLEGVEWKRSSQQLSAQQLLLEELLHILAVYGYQFTTVTPLTHQRFLTKANRVANNMGDVFGWNLPFKSAVLPPRVFELLSQAKLLAQADGYWRSKIRVSSLGSDLFLHSGFPTNDTESVFFGPDTYRFARFIKQALNTLQLQKKVSSQRTLKVLDVGCGSGAGGISAIRALGANQSFELFLNDVNPIALEYATACTRAAGVPAMLTQDDFFKISSDEFDLIVANPPYICDPAGRLYRDGGSQFGLELSLRMARHALTLLGPTGRLLLYTGVAVTDQPHNPFLSELLPHINRADFHWTYEEIDPDIFGEELEKPEYRGVNRIAAIGFECVREGNDD